MFNLPKGTEIKPPKIIYKKLIYEKFKDQLTGKKKESFDEDISRVTLTHELSERSLHLPKTEEVPSIFVARIDLKTRDYREENIILLSKLFGQKMLLLLAFEGEYKPALYEEKLVAREWQGEEDIDLELRGLELKSLWENLARAIGEITIEEGKTLQEQIQREEEKEKLKKQIRSLEKRAQREKQSKKKLELFREIKKYKKELEEM